MTPESLGVADDLVAQALHALSLFGPRTAQDARLLLSMWARRDELTDAERAQVLAYYGNEPTDLGMWGSDR